MNTKGGESVATPLQWAAQRCHYYTVHLLLQHGADPLVTDAQGYNTLHISTFNGNVLLLTLLLHTGIPVDVLDSYGHTGLMWAAYKGFPACVDVYLRWGASVHAKDESGFTALHWALVKGSPGCVQKLIEYGADRFAKTETGKTPAITAEELKTLPAWHRALKECGYDEDGHLITPSFPGASYLVKDRRGFVTKFTFLFPLLIVWSMLGIMASFPVFAGVPIALAVGYVFQEVAKRVLTFAPPDMRQFQRTPWMAGIFSASLFLVSLRWFLTVLPATTFRAGEPLPVVYWLCCNLTDLRRRRTPPSPNEPVPGWFHWLLRMVLLLLHGLRPWLCAQDERHRRAESRHRRTDRSLEVRRGKLLRSVHDPYAPEEQALPAVSAMCGAT